MGQWLCISEIMLNSEKSKLTVPLSVAAAFALLTLLVWQTFAVQERTALKEQTQAVANAFAREIELTTRTHENAVLRMAERWEASEGTPQDLWELDAQNYVNDLPGLAAFDWIDEAYRIRWSIPEIGRKDFVGFDAESNAQFKTYLDRVRESDRITSSSIYESSAGIKAISFYAPLYVDGTFGGFMGGVLDVEKFLESQHFDYLNEIQVQLLNGDLELYTSFDKSLKISSNRRVSTTGKIGENEFPINAVPTAAFIEQNTSPILQRLVLGLGLLLAVMFGLMTHQLIRMSMGRRRMVELDSTLERQAAALSQTNDAVFVQSPDGHIIDCNESATTVFGYSKQELMGMNVDALIDSQFEYEKLKRDEVGRLPKGTAMSAVMECRTKDGRRISVEVELTPFDNDAGETVAHIATARDITKQEESKRKLAQSEKRFRGLFSENRDGIVIRVASGDSARAGEIIDVNQVYLDMIGYSRQEVDQLALADLVKSADDRERIQQAVKQLRTQGYSDDCNIEYCRKDGSTFSVNVQFWTLIGDEDGQKQTISVMRDVSETRQAVAQMKEAQELAHVGNWTFEVATGAFTWTEEVTRIYEIDDGADISPIQDSTSKVHPDDLERYRQFQKDCLNERAPQSITIRLQMSDGRIKYVHIVSRTTFADDGTPVKRFGTVQDVTDQRLVEERLEEAQRLSQVGNWELDYKTGTSIWSKEIYRILGFDQSEGKPPFGVIVEIIHPDDEEEFNTYIDRLRTHGHETGCVCRVRTKNGEIRHIRFTARVHFAADGTAVRQSGTMQDITDQKEKEAVLQRHSIIFEQMSEAVFVIDLESKILDLNKSGERITGYTKNELVGQDAKILIAKEEGFEERRVLQYKTVKEKRFKKSEFALRHKDGGLRQIEVSLHPLFDDRGNIIAHIGGWSQLIDATLYLKRNDGVLADGTKISSRI